MSKKHKKQKLLETPAVIPLPDDSPAAKAERAVAQFKERNPPEPAWKKERDKMNRRKEEGTDLVVAAGGEVVDAEFTAVEESASLEAVENVPPVGEPLDEADLVANEIAERPNLDALFDDSLTDIGHSVLDEQWIKLKTGAKKLGLYLIAKGNEFSDWAAKQYVAAQGWLNERTEKLQAWALNAIAEFNDWRANTFPAKATNFYALNELTETVKKLEETFKAEMRRTDKRITRQEDELRKLRKQVTAPAVVDDEQLQRFLKAAMSGRKNLAIDAYRELTGKDLPTAMAAVDKMVSA